MFFSWKSPFLHVSDARHTSINRVNQCFQRQVSGDSQYSSNWGYGWFNLTKLYIYIDRKWEFFYQFYISVQRFSLKFSSKSVSWMKIYQRKAKWKLLDKKGSWIQLFFDSWGFIKLYIILGNIYHKGVMWGSPKLNSCFFRQCFRKNSNSGQYMKSFLYNKFEINCRVFVTEITWSVISFFPLQHPPNKP